MWSEIAQLLLVFTMIMLALYATVSLVALSGLRSEWSGLALALMRPSAYLQWIFIALSFFILVCLFLTHDFSVSYIAGHSNSLLPWYYQISAVWGGHEGSLLLWVLILGSWYALVVRHGSYLPREFLGLVAGVMAVIQVGFLGFILATSNPFAPLPLPHPVDGQDLNPLLQDIGLIFHPPLLYMGYVGLSVAFSFSIAGLIYGGVGSTWARWTRPWTLYAWAFLTLGIALGSWWAYYELGWGGWWFWDPVENASLMPWLAATGLIHSLAVTDKRGTLKAWTLFLAILAFSLSLLGTFLVRSGVLTSVHSFAADPSRGLFILALLGFVIGGSLLLFACRAHLVASDVELRPVSREGSLLVNNILLCVATFVIFVGTLYPLFEEMMGLTQSSIGAPYFNLMFVPLTLLLLFFLALGPRLHWKAHLFSKLKSLLLWPWVFGAIVAIVTFMSTGEWQVALTAHLVAALCCSIVLDLRHQSRHAKTFQNKVKRLKPQLLGMHLAHFGLAVMVIGVTGVSFFSHENDVLMTIGEQYSLGDYEVSLSAVNAIEGPNYRAMQGVVQLVDGDHRIELKPEKRFYLERESVMTEAAMRAGLFGDLYVALGEARSDTQWAVRVHHKPMIRWVWGGALLIALGGIWASFDRRYKRQPDPDPAKGVAHVS